MIVYLCEDRCVCSLVRGLISVEHLESDALSGAADALDKVVYITALHISTADVRCHNKGIFKVGQVDARDE